MHSWGQRLFAFFSISFFIISCSPAPRRVLTTEEKTADMYWLFSQFQQNYAPLAYKEQRYGFKFENLKQQYLAQAQQTKSNEEFYRLMQRFVAEFKDAHTSGSISKSSLPNRTLVAYLGFDGVRHADRLLVKELLPTIATNTKYPVKIGDEITKLDGVALTEIVKNEFIFYRHLGHDEANLTYHLPKIFNRNSLTHNLPKNANAVLTVMRGEKEHTIEVPWITKDLYDFTRQQEEAAKAEEKEGRTSHIRGLVASEYFSIGLKNLLGKTEKTPEFFKRMARHVPGFDYRRSFAFIDTSPSWSSRTLQKLFEEETETAETVVDELKRERNLPSNTLYLSNRAFPTFIWPEKVLGADKKPTGKLKHIAYMYLNTFSADFGDDTIVKELKADLQTLVAMGVKDLVIDLIDNGGGSIATGLLVAQTLSPTRLVTPEMQFRISETWLDEFEQKKIQDISDADSEIARRVFQGLVDDQSKGQWLSQKWSTETLMPFQMEPNLDVPSDFKIYLLVNEMCASMCDIFTGILKDNRWATVIGSKTMGAGGNVVQHPEAPNSHFVVNQTESLILRRDGSYIENNGVEPDIALKMGELVKGKYSDARAKAVELILATP